MSGNKYVFVKDHAEGMNYWLIGQIVEPMQKGWATTLVQRGILKPYDETQELRQRVERIAQKVETAAMKPKRGRPRKIPQ